MTDTKYKNSINSEYETNRRNRRAVSWTLGSIAVLSIVGVGTYFALNQGIPGTNLAYNPDANNMAFNTDNVRVLSEAQNNPGLTPQGVDLRITMRKLWSDHVFWTREYVNAVAAGLPTSDIVNRLVRNQEDIGNAIAPYYGTTAASQLATLLKEHITIATDLIKALKANNQANIQDAQTRANTNADAIAALLSSVNPNINNADLASMMKEHVNLLAEEARARLQRDYAGSITIFDQVFDQAMVLADTLADAIIRQYPNGPQPNSVNTSNTLPSVNNNTTTPGAATPPPVANPPVTPSTDNSSNLNNSVPPANPTTTTPPPTTSNPNY